VQLDGAALARCSLFAHVAFFEMPRARRTAPVIAVLRAFVVSAVAVAVLTAVPAPAQSPSPAPPTFTDSQATRGQSWFEAVCQSCHPTREMVSPDFRVRWSGRSALDLYERISTTMPQSEPGSLSRRAYTDIVTYLLQLNGLPAGTVPLTADSLALAAVRLAFPTPSSAPR
jgi:mono/diheme cytochrome c family protein